MSLTRREEFAVRIFEQLIGRETSFEFDSIQAIQAADMLINSLEAKTEEQNATCEGCHRYLSSDHHCDVPEPTEYPADDHDEHHRSKIKALEWELDAKQKKINEYRSYLSDIMNLANRKYASVNFESVLETLGSLSKEALKL